MAQKYDAVIFDVLNGLVDSWTLWNSVVSGKETGTRCRYHYLQLTYGIGDLRPYEGLVVQAARECGLGEELGVSLIDRWYELKPWPETAHVLKALKVSGVTLAVVTNCSLRLGRMASRKPVSISTWW